MTAVTANSETGAFWRPSAPAAPPLRVAHRLRSDRCLAATVLAAIAAFTLLLTAAPIVSSLNLFGTETGVAAQTGPAQAIVGPGGAETPAVVGGNSPYAYDVMSGCCVAPSGARVWTSVDDHVGGAANAIESAFPGRITGVNQNITMTTRSGFREVDIVLDGVLVQVKGGNAGGLTGQVLRTSETTGQTVIGFAPDIPEAAWAAAARQGVPIARNHDELIAMIAELG